MHRWIRYEAPVMVCVAIDDGGHRVVNVVIGQEAEDIRLARDAGGQPLVYDEHMELLDPSDPTAQHAARETETASGLTRKPGKTARTRCASPA